MAATAFDTAYEDTGASDARAEGPSLGTLIKRHRRAAGLTQTELAERARLSLHAVSNLERGVARLPHRTTLDLLASALGLTSEAFDALLDVLRVARGAEGFGAAAPLTLPPLPAPLTPLIGREELLCEVSTALRQRDARLFTLVGSPGVGKTRLALATAWEVYDAFGQQVAFVPLAALEDAALVLPALVQRLGVSEGSEPLLTSLTAVLRGHPMLLVLDNFEQIVDAAPRIADLLMNCPELVVLATSRCPLGLRGERQIAVPPLALPSNAASLSLSELLESPSAAVLLASAQRAAPSFMLAPDDAPIIAAICRRLDGLPLAMELVAPRLRLLSPAALLERLERRLPLAESGPRDLPQHQRTIRDAIAWSYDRLNAAEQALFCLCGVFIGGATLDAIASVVAACHPDLPDCLPMLEALLEQNLLVRDDGGSGDGPRIRMLETLRDYALTQCNAIGEIDAVRRVHADYFAARLEDDERCWTSKRAWWIARCEADLPNLRAALQWAMNGGDVETGLRISGSLGTYWYLSGRLNEGMRWLADLLTLAGADESSVGVSVRAKALYMAGWIACDQGRAHDAVALLERCVALRRRHGTEASLIETLHRLAAATALHGDLSRAEAILEECLAYHRRVADTVAVLVSLNALANVAFACGDDLTFEDRLRVALPLARGHGDPGWTVLFLAKLSRCAQRHGDCSTASALFDEGVQMATAASDDQTGQSVPTMLLNLAYIARELGRQAEARAFGEASVARFRTAAHDDGLAYACLILGQIAVDQGDMLAAAANYAEALTIYENFSARHALANCFERIAAFALTSARPIDATTLCGVTAALRVAIGVPLAHREREAYARTLATLQNALLPDIFAAAYTRGEALLTGDALALARSILAPAEGAAASPSEWYTSLGASAITKRREPRRAQRWTTPPRSAYARRNPPRRNPS